MRGQTGAGIAAITDSARISAGRHRQFDGARNRSLRPEHTSRPGIDTNLRRNVPTVDPAQ
jgi:hypothetical protein